MNTNDESSESKDYHEDVSRAFRFIKDMIVKNEEEGRMPAPAWASALISMSLQLMLSCGVGYEDFCVETEKMKDCYKHWLEEEEKKNDN